VRSGERVAGRGFTEYFRKDWFGRVADTQYRLVPRGEAYAFRDPDGDGEEAGGWGMDDGSQGRFAQAPTWREYFDPRSWRGPTAEPPWWADVERPRRRPRRVDPDYFFGNGRVY
jgi:penicillin-binding protein 1A